MEFTSAATNDATKLSRHAAKVRGAVIVAQNSCQVSVADLKKIVDNGATTITSRYVSVKPRASRKPGNTRLVPRVISHLAGSGRRARHRQKMSSVPLPSRRTH